MDKKLNLGSIKYDDVLNIEPNILSCEKIVKSNWYDWLNRGEEQVTFVFSNQTNPNAVISFFFESDTKKITRLGILFPIETDIPIIFECINKSQKIKFPFQEKDMFLIFGEKTQIFKDYPF